jgi:hypothetical protein
MHVHYSTGWARHKPGSCRAKRSILYESRKSIFSNTSLIEATSTRSTGIHAPMCASYWRTRNPGFVRCFFFTFCVACVHLESTALTCYPPPLSIGIMYLVRAFSTVPGTHIFRTSFNLRTPTRSEAEVMMDTHLTRVVRYYYF